jgi:Pentapeptide repeats (9 copies)
MQDYRKSINIYFCLFFLFLCNCIEWKIPFDCYFNWQEDKILSDFTEKMKSKFKTLNRSPEKRHFWLTLVCTGSVDFTECIFHRIIFHRIIFHRMHISPNAYFTECIFHRMHISPIAYFTESYFTECIFHWIIFSECIFHRIHFQRIKTIFYLHRFRIFQRTILTENNVLSTQISATISQFQAICNEVGTLWGERNLLFLFSIEKIFLVCTVAWTTIFHRRSFTEGTSSS